LGGKDLFFFFIAIMTNLLEALEKQGMGMQIIDIPSLRRGKTKKESLKDSSKLCEKYFGKKPTIKGAYRECANCRKSTLRPVSVNYIEEFMDLNNNDKIEYKKLYPERFTKPKKFKHCSRCKITYYCDKKCQTEHWPKHKIECKKKKPSQEEKEKGKRKKKE